MRDLSLHQALVAVAALIGITVLGALDRVSSEALIAVYSMSLGGAAGYLNGAKAHKKPNE